MHFGRRVARGILDFAARSLSVSPHARAWTSRTLVVAPHPDDEVLGCGGTIALKAAAGCDVRVVVMTDGRASHTHLIEADRLIDMRRAEAHRAAAALGLLPGSCSVLEFADQELGTSREEAAQEMLAIVREFEPLEIYVPHHADRLADHVDTFSIVVSVLPQCGREVTILEYPVWLWHTWPWVPRGEHGRSLVQEGAGILRDAWRLVAGCRVRVDVSSVHETKMRALQEHRSQVQRLGGDPNWTVLGDVASGEFLRCLTGQYEVFRRWTFKP